MEQPKEQTNRPPRVVPGQFIEKTCKHCGAPMRIELSNNGDGGSKVPRTSATIEAVLVSLAGSIACDECAARYISKQEGQRLARRAGALVDGAHVLAGFGKHSIDSSVAEFELVNASSWAKVRAWIEDPARSLFVQGPPDTGKTWMCRTALFERFKRGASVAECTGWDLFSGALLSVDEQAQARVRRMRGAGVLYIQQIDRGTPGVKHLDLLLSIMEERHAKGLITIMETQRPPDDLVEYWGRLTQDANIGESIITRLNPVTVLKMEKPRRSDGFGMRRIAGEKGAII